MNTLGNKGAHQHQTPLISPVAEDEEKKHHKHKRKIYRVVSKNGVTYCVGDEVYRHNKDTGETDHDCITDIMRYHKNTEHDHICIKYKLGNIIELYDFSEVEYMNCPEDHHHDYSEYAAN